MQNTTEVPRRPDMSVQIAGIRFQNPVMTASGTFGSGMEYCDFVDLNRLGAVVTKGVSNVPWEEIRRRGLQKCTAACSMPSACRIRGSMSSWSAISPFWSNLTPGSL